MTNVRVSITYNTSEPSRALSSYSVSIDDSDVAPTGGLKQDGPIFSNLSRSVGIFPSISDGAKAVFEYIRVYCKLVEITDADSGTVVDHRVFPIDWKSPKRNDREYRVLASSNQHGIFIDDSAK